MTREENEGEDEKAESEKTAENNSDKENSEGVEATVTDKEKDRENVTDKEKNEGNVTDRKDEKRNTDEEKKDVMDEGKNDSDVMDERGDDGGVERRTLIKVVIALTVGIPILLESITFFGLLTSSGSSKSEKDGGDGKKVETVSPGDEILPTTPQKESVVESITLFKDSGWEYKMGIEVENPTEGTYTLRFGELELEKGKKVEGGMERSVEAGGTKTLEAKWEIPQQTSPRKVTVSASYSGSEGEKETTEELILGSVAVKRE